MHFVCIQEKSQIWERPVYSTSGLYHITPCNYMTCSLRVQYAENCVVPVYNIHGTRYCSTDIMYTSMPACLLSPSPRSSIFTWIHATWCWWRCRLAACTSSPWDGLRRRTHTCWRFHRASRCWSCKSSLPRKALCHSNLALHSQILPTHQERENDYIS